MKRKKKRKKKKAKKKEHKISYIKNKRDSIESLFYAI